MNYSEQFIVKPGTKIRLADIDPAMKMKDKQTAKTEVKTLCEKIYDYQYLLFAENKRSLLVCLQAMDAGGKDGTIAHVFGATNPQGTHVHSFKVPSTEEAEHDFLWRVHLHTPRRGEIAIFNRSHYEDVLVVRVHQLVPKSVWSKRYDIINDFEQNLVANDTYILKFFLHISKEEQLRRFKKRLEDPERQWKIAESDYEERKRWDAYQEAYEDSLARTSTEKAPWFVIPADHKWFRNLVVSNIVAETFASMKMKLPTVTVDLEEIRHKYHAAVAEEKNEEA